MEGICVQSQTPCPKEDAYAKEIGAIIARSLRNPASSWSSEAGVISGEDRKDRENRENKENKENRGKLDLLLVREETDNSGTLRVGIEFCASAKSGNKQ